MNLDFYVKYCSLASSDYGATTDSGRSSATVSPTLPSSDVSSATTANFAAVGGPVHQSPIAAMLINAASINNNKQPGPVSPTTSCDSGNGGGGSGTANAKYKTEMCRSVFAKIQCKYGDNCQFAHTEDEMRNRPRNNKYKTINCKNFHLKGYCYYGPKCDFRHNEPLPPNFSATTSNSDRFRFSSVSPPSSSSTIANFAMTTKSSPNFVDSASSSSTIFATTNLQQQQQQPQYNQCLSSPFNFLSLTSTTDATTTVNNSSNSSGGDFFSTFSPRSDSTPAQQQQQQGQSSSYFCRRTGSDGDSPAPSDYDSYVQV